MLSKIISEIKNELEKQGISQSAIARRIGEEQKNVNNLLAGRTKRINVELVEKLRGALGMVADPQEGYAGEPRFQVVEEIGPESDPIRLAVNKELDKMDRKQLTQILAQCLEINGEQYDLVKHESRDNRRKRLNPRSPKPILERMKKAKANPEIIQPIEI